MKSIYLVGVTFQHTDLKDGFRLVAGIWSDNGGEPTSTTKKKYAPVHPLSGHIPAIERNFPYFILFPMHRTNGTGFKEDL